MAEQLFFLQDNDSISGPFTREKIIVMLRDGDLQLNNQISMDSSNFCSIRSVLDNILQINNASSAEQPSRTGNKAAANNNPAQQTPPSQSDNQLKQSPPVNKLTDLPPEPPANSSNINHAVYVAQTAKMFTLANSVAEHPSDRPDAPAFQNQIDRSFMRILSHVIGSLGNGSGYLQKLWLCGTKAMIMGGVIALLLSFVMTLLGCLLFAKFYFCPVPEFYIRSFLTLLTSGIIFWLGNLLTRSLASPAIQIGNNEADFLAAMHGVFNTSMLITTTHSTMFLLTSMPTVMTFYLALAIMSLVGGFFLINTIVSLRINFMHSSRLNVFQATLYAYLETWVMLATAIIILKPIY